MKKHKNKTERAISMENVEETNEETNEIIDEVMVEAPKQEITTRKESIMDNFINSKAELSRYSMSSAFKNFCAVNKSLYNDLQAEKDIGEAFSVFFK